MAGVLLVDAQGHGIIAAKIASTVHDTFHALMLSELDHRGKTTPELFERMNLRLALSVTARNALGRSEQESAQEIATLLYGEVHPYGYFRFVTSDIYRHSCSPPNFAISWRWTKIGWRNSWLGLQIPEDHPDRNRYFSLEFRERSESSDVAELTLMNPGDIFFLYTDGVYDGSDKEERHQLESVIWDHQSHQLETSAMHYWHTRRKTMMISGRLAKMTALMTKLYSSSNEVESLT